MRFTLKEHQSEGYYIQIMAVLAQRKQGYLEGYADGFDTGLYTSIDA